MDLDTSGIDNKEIAKMMQQYNKIVSMIRDDCEKKGYRFVGYGYFCPGDKVTDDAYNVYVHTNVYLYDKYYVQKSIAEYVLGD